MISPGAFWQYLDNWSGIDQFNFFFLSTALKKCLDFSRLKTSSIGTLFAFNQFLLSHSG